MSSQLQVFAYSMQSTVRTVFKDDQVWFVAKDVCDVLGLANPTMAISDLDSEDRDDLSISDAIGRQQKMNVISEAGLYELIFKSRKPEARQFFGQGVLYERAASYH